MDVKTYATVVDLCARFAGRLSDTVLDAVRVHYYVGEDVIAESAMLLGLALEGVGVTHDEHDQIRSVLDDPNNPDLDGVPIVDELPPIEYRFSATGPPGAPDPTRADDVLEVEAQRHGGRRLLRAWRDPVDAAHGDGTWLYVVQVAPDADELRAYSGLSSKLGVTVQLTWPIEVVTEGNLLPPYQAAALTAARLVWSA
jgi:hypothetical protein